MTKKAVPQVAICLISEGRVPKTASEMNVVVGQVHKELDNPSGMLVPNCIRL